MKFDLNIRITGGAGQGIHTIGSIVSRMAVLWGYHFHATQDYMSRIRGGRNSYTVRIGSEPVRAGREAAEILVCLNPEHLSYYLPKMAAGGLALADVPSAQLPVIAAPLKEMAVSAGSPILANMAGAGIVASALGVSLDVVDPLIAADFKGEFLDKNRKALSLGWGWGRERVGESFRLPRAPFSPRTVLSGNEALALGAIAGGCKFAAGYPMTPGTGILSALADNGPAVGLVFEQAEDEIAALNMAIGASYAGARSMVATAGGGFALMVEALSLAGELETPVVIAVGMRPGPATGMPTRTEQGDIDFVLSAGHGEFPRLVLSPGSPEEAFQLAQHAMDLAEEFQVPAIILTDQYLADTIADIDPAALEIRPMRRHTVSGADVPRTQDGKYLRYAVTAEGVSPMALPGEPGITVVAGSDEHTEDGHLTEDHDARIRMVEKRKRKGEALALRALPPLVSGPPNGEVVLVGFGSTKEPVEEARGILSLEGISAAAVHLRQVWPFPAKEMAEILPRYDAAFTVENNITGQLARLIRREAGAEMPGTIARYDGLPFTPEKLAAEARKKIWEARSTRASKTRGARDAETSGS
ncbi:MAG: 2-oxoacid:acceptor oxidoreductase subunit alpha [Deltaproteobacteria bacterium]|nr:2-oxoacid:acceptor oxidoreductase subunit alpha [Deltaproteobacteria bacterium]